MLIGIDGLCRGIEGLGWVGDRGGGRDQWRHQHLNLFGENGGARYISGGQR